MLENIKHTKVFLELGENLSKEPAKFILGVGNNEETPDENKKYDNNIRKTLWDFINICGSLGMANEDITQFFEIPFDEIECLQMTCKNNKLKIIAGSEDRPFFYPYDEAQNTYLDISIREDGTGVVRSNMYSVPRMKFKSPDWMKTLTQKFINEFNLERSIIIYVGRASEKYRDKKAVEE